MVFDAQNILRIILEYLRNFINYTVKAIVQEKIILKLTSLQIAVLILYYRLSKNSEIYIVKSV